MGPQPKLLSEMPGAAMDRRLARVLGRVLKNRPVCKIRKLAEAQLTPKLPSYPGRFPPDWPPLEGSFCIPTGSGMFHLHDALWPTQKQGDTAPSTAPWLRPSFWASQWTQICSGPGIGLELLLALSSKSLFCYQGDSGPELPPLALRFRPLWLSSSHPSGWGLSPPRSLEGSYKEVRRPASRAS